MLLLDYGRQDAEAFALRILMQQTCQVRVRGMNGPPAQTNGDFDRVYRSRTRPGLVRK